MHKRTGVTLAETLIIIGIVVLLNVVGYFLYLRLDMTRNQMYTLSASTRRILHKLKDPVSVEFFMSKDLPPGQLITIRDAVRDKLSDYRALSGGKFRVKYTDPGDNPKEKDRATGLGVPQIKVQVVKQEQATVQEVWFGMVLNYRDKSEAIPQAVQPETLEYEITSRLMRMTMAEKPKIGLFTGSININQQKGPSYQGLHQILGGQQGFYDIVDIDAAKDKKLPDGLSGVVLMGAFGMGDELKYSLDQFLLHGGNVLLCFDPMMQTGQGQQGGLGDGYPALPTIEDQLEKYGLKVNKKLVVDIGSPAMAQFRESYMVLQEAYPLWVKIGPAGISKKVGALAGLASVTLPWCAPLSDEARPGVTFTPLFFSSDKSFLLNSPFKLDPNQNWQFLQTASPEKGPFKLAYQVEGAIPTAYPAGPPKPAPGQPTPFDASKHLAVGNGKGRLIVITNASAFSDNFLQQFQDDVMMLANLGDMLALGEDLASIRNTQITARPLKTMDQAAKEAVRWALILSVPLLVVAFGLLLWMRKNQRRKAIAARYGG